MRGKVGKIDERGGGEEIRREENMREHERMEGYGECDRRGGEGRREGDR